MPLTVQNNEANTTVFAKTVGGDLIRITWLPKGHPEDTKRVPDAFADDIDFLNALDQGVFDVLDGPPDVLAKIHVEVDKAKDLRAATLARQAAQTEQVMNRAQDRDLIGSPCIGPGARTGMTCGVPVLVAHAQVDSVPPLCQKHQHLAPSFFLAETGSKGEGATESRAGVVRREWKQAQMTAPQRGVA